MEVKNIVLHHIIKDRKGKPSLKCSKKLLIINETLNEFVSTLIKNYSSKNPTQGTFEANSEIYPFQKKCKQYTDDKDFLKFTTEAMEILEREIDIATTTGGYVVFVHYIEKKNDFIITAMLDRSTQFTVDDEDLGIEKLLALDIEKLARANRINVNNWQKGEALYLSFIKGTRDVSKYFLKFIGSTDITSSKENFNKLRESLDIYYRANRIDRVTKEKTKEAISTYIQKCYTEKNDVELSSISSILNSEKPEAFTQYLKDNEIEVSGKITIHRASDYDLFIRNRVKEQGYSLVFDKALIKNGKITKNGNNIIIKDVPQQLLDAAFENEKGNS